jgi:hypothetical protein
MRQKEQFCSGESTFQNISHALNFAKSFESYNLRNIKLI